MWALVATFIKTTTDTLTEFGVAGMFTHWPVYALVVGAVAGTLLQQAALHVGPLKVSQPFLVIIDPVVSIALSVWLFAEYFTSTPGTGPSGGRLRRDVRRGGHSDPDRTGDYERRPSRLAPSRSASCRALTWA